ncbi:MAG: UDP-N-acetylglucosamine 2-epimerase (non-hydrolyzing) [Candidatus Micrarchaeota archaeon]|nr:UDP-N-acetylglucosamine 2-epimerase (non-hydrolyzing) [Candidatus Micrarchaeota archaeon]
MKLLFSAGTRPEIIKIAPVIKEAEKRGHACVLVWSGQHYNRELFMGVFEDLGIRKPDYELDSRGTPCEIGAGILTRLEGVIRQEKPDIVLVHGDTFTAFFSAISAALCQVPVGHIEAGLRTHSWEPFPEQICTRGADAASSLYFAATERNVRDLLNEGHPRDRIFLTGNTVVDAVRIYGGKNKGIREQLGIPNDKKLIFFSAHRRENTLSRERMEGMFEALLELKDYTVFCAVLPGTQAAAEKYGYLDRLKNAPHIIWKNPSLEKYTDVLSLVGQSDLVLTDSGGLQEETASMGVPCLTLRYVTDRPETLESGSNYCIGFKKGDIIRWVDKVMSDEKLRKRMSTAKNPYGDGHSSELIVDIIERFNGKMARWETKVREVK